jgi:hypothetical protein
MEKAKVCFRCFPFSLLFFFFNGCFDSYWWETVHWMERAEPAALERLAPVRPLADVGRVCPCRLPLSSAHPSSCGCERRKRDSI